MHNDPILILQMQRLGDLVMSYPLLGWLGVAFAGSPLWVVGEECFFSGLIPLSPPAVYFPYSAAGKLKARRYRAVINLSHRDETLALAGSLRTELLLGPYRDTSGAVHVGGAWHLYRASLTHNNRHNRFHWADLNGLDLVDASRLLRTAWPLPRRTRVSGSAHIGLFLGASEAEKRPREEFWTALARHLLQAGHRPVLLGGEAEKDMGKAVARALGAPALSLCGRFSVKDLAEFIAGLDLMVSPDTGPMHVAAWTGTPTLNLSMGPVNAWETGPFSPGHHVLRARLSCVGCWQCTRPDVRCRERFSPSRTAFVAHQLLTSDEEALGRVHLPGQELLRTERGAFGLYALTPCRFMETGPAKGRDLLGGFWQAFFGYVLGLMPEETARRAWTGLSAAFPRLVLQMPKALAILSRQLAEGMRKGSQAQVHDPDFWRRGPVLIRPFASYTQLLLQNGMYGKPSYAEALRLVEQLALILR